MVKMAYRTLESFYEGVQSLITQLRAENHESDADKLRSLMEASWTTSSELLGELCLELKRMKSGYSSETSRAIKDCLSFAANHRRTIKQTFPPKQPPAPFPPTR